MENAAYFPKKTGMVYLMIKEKLTEFCEKNFSRYLKILEEMVSTNSFTDNKDGVNKLGAYTADLFAPLGFLSEFVSSINPSYGNHLICVKEGKGRGSVALVSHLDTVFSPEEEEKYNFRFKVVDDRVYGPGTCDIKGGTLVMYMMLEALKENIPEFYDSISWYLLFDASEETGSADFGALCAKVLPQDAAAALVFEAGALMLDKVHLVTSRKGRAVFRIESVGRGAHAGTSHQDGVNAITKLCKAVLSMAKLTDYSKSITVNTGIIKGGSGLNRVPENAYADIEMRAFYPDLFSETIGKIKSFAHRDEVSELKVQLIQAALPWPENPRSIFLKNVWGKAAEKMNLKAESVRRGGLSDGNFLWNILPVIDALGPTGSNAHCSERADDGSRDQEFAVLSSFVPKAVLNMLGIIQLFDKTDESN